MIYTMPLRRMTRHLEQRLRMEGETFIISISLLAACLMTAKGLIILVIFLSVYIYNGRLRVRSQDSQDERFSFGDGNCMFKMRRQ